MSVDHRKPLCDGFCRCRRCKPPLVRGEQTARRCVASVGLAFVLVIIAAWVRVA